MDLNLRKFAKFVDKTFIEGGKEAKEPVLLVSVAAVIKNPWAGKGFVYDLKPVILDLAPKLGDILVPELIKEIGSGDKILAYGKAAMVGLNGEIEHASAFIHTLRFGNKFRDALAVTSTEWKVRGGGLKNKLHDRKIKRKLAYLYRIFQRRER